MSWYNIFWAWLPHLLKAAVCRGLVPGVESGGQLDQGPSLCQLPFIEHVQCARCCAKPFTYLISCGPCLLLLQQCSNLNIQKLLLPGSSWNTSGTSPLLSYPRTQGFTQSKGTHPICKQQVATKSWSALPVHQHLLLPPGVAFGHGCCTVPRALSTGRPGAPFGRDCCTGGREALNLDTRSHPSWLLIILSGMAHCRPCIVGDSVQRGF